ncbi:MAG: TonB-dependent receptor [Chitinophagaceae bacterium]
MRKGLRFFTVFAVTMLVAVTVFAQNITISGTVKTAASNEPVAAVSVLVQGSSQGTFTDPNGNFTIRAAKLPATLIISSVGFESQQITVKDASKPVQVSFVQGNSLGQEVVVAATRLPQRFLESPVTIESISAATIRNAPSPDYYDLTKNLKGVDLTTSSFTFKTVSTRGFNGSGNLRFNQLIDGMDNQAPGLNFSVGSIVGPTELDIDNVELLPGASSALYGSGGMNGTMLISSKSPFKYQGLSFQIKQGLNHTDGSQHSPAPYYDWAVRWGKVIGEKFGFKLSGQFIKAQDWQAMDKRNILRNNVFSSLKPGNRTTDPNYDGVNVFGDEASTSMNSLAQAVVAQASAQALPLVTQQIAAACGCTPTQAQIQAGLASFLSTNATTRPFYLGIQNNVFGGQFVSRTGYDEKDLVDYNAYNIRLTGGLYYKINSNTEASLIANYGTGTTVYTGADRYAIKNLKMGQYKAEVKNKNWFLRGYTTLENSGDAYTATTAALFINNTWKSNTNWFQQYVGTYAGARLQGVPDAQAHSAARSTADQGRYLPGTDAFKAAFNNAIGTSINKGGAKFDDHTNLYQAEGQLNLTDYVKVLDVLVGASYRLYHLNSNGTIFVDTTGPINISEVGGYVQLQKSLLNDVLKLTLSGRYDKNKNFEGRFTPRATALVKVAPNNNIRLSYQTAYRFPSTQDQYINLLTGGVNRLIGGLPEFETFFKFNTNPAYTAESIVAYRNSVSTGIPNPTLLQKAQFTTIKPETVNSYELGYRGLVTKNFLIDANVYYSQYKDFIGRTAVGRGTSDNPALAPQDLASPFTTNNYSFVVNSGQTVNALGWGIGFSYQFAKGYGFTTNFSSDQLQNVPSGLVTFFNTPRYRFNIGLGNQNVYSGIGFAVNYRWQDEVYWEGTFGTGNVPSFGVVDAQVSYKIPNTKSIFKLGGSNILNRYYQSAFGNPMVGGLYYVSFGYNL